MLNDRDLYIVYDGECPFCASYVKLLRLRDTGVPVHIVSARDAHPAVDYVRARGVVLDQEMALINQGRVVAGADCMNWLALMSTTSGVFNRVNRIVFGSPAMARAAYPVLRAGRNAALRLLGRKRLGF